jgi:hypothetical protein
MSNYVGASLVRTSQSVVFDTVHGDGIQETYAGPLQALLGLASSLKSAGVRCEVTQEAGRSVLSAIWPSIEDGTVETANDRYELSTDLVEEDIWNNPQVYSLAVSELASYDPGTRTVTTAGDLVALWKSRIEFALKGNDDGTAQTPTEAGFENSELALYNAVLAGATSYESERVVLRRVRSISIRYATPTTPVAIPRIYTTAQLVSTFGIPSGIAARLPMNPTYAPLGLTWTWRKRQDTSVYTWSGKVEEVKDWVFAPHSTVCYDYVS